MALKERHIKVGYLPQEGVVKDEKISQTSNVAVLRSAQETLALYGCSVYVPNMDERLKGQPVKGRKISYSHALSVVYTNLSIFKNYTSIRENDNDELKSDKKIEREMIENLMNDIKETFPEIAKSEYPDNRFEISDRSISMNMSGDPQEFNLSGSLRKSIGGIRYKLAKFNEFVALKSPTFAKKTVNNLSEYHKYIDDKFERKEVYLRQKTDAEKMDDVYEDIERLIRTDDKIDRDKSAKALARKLDKMGLELACVHINENQTEEQKVINNTKTCVLRASWDGFIERPRDTSVCSPAFQEYVYKANSPVDPKSYKLENSKIWNICSQVPEFADLKFTVVNGLSSMGFPPERVSELRYPDIAMIINMQKSISSHKLEKLQKRNKGGAVADAVRIKSAREKYFKEFAHKYEKELRLLLASQGKSKEFANDVVEKMRTGKAVDSYFDGHHNFPLSDPEGYEKATGRSWTQMNSDVRLLSKDVHTLLHATENNVNAIGKIIREDAKSSHRTIFENEQNGQKFYFVIRVKENIKSILGFNHEAIFDKKYLSELVLEEKNQFTHAKERLNSLNEKKNEQVSKDTGKKLGTMGRPNNRGLGKFGGLTVKSRT